MSGARSRRQERETVAGCRDEGDEYPCAVLVEGRNFAT